jgi:RNA polymerase sigma-70 factor (ECF subfamily)
MQETFLQLWHRSEQYNANLASPVGWLTLIARSRALDLLRKRKPLQGDSSADPGFEIDMSLGLVRDESRAAVRSALSSLPADQRQVIRMAFMGGMTHEQIAAMLGLPLGTVKTRIRLGLRRMRNMMPSEDG